MFYQKSKRITIESISQIIEIKNLDQIDINIEIEALSDLSSCLENSLTFFSYNKISGDKFLSILKEKKPKFCVVSEIEKNMLPIETKAIIVEMPYIAFLSLYNEFYKPVKRITEIDGTAIISPSAIIKEGAKIGSGVIIKENVVIGENASISENCIIDENVVINFAEIGANCHIRTGAKIGQDGFGFLTEKVHGVNKPFRIKHFGGVVIGEDVSIGANTCLDRGTFDNTQIGSYSKIDNLVQIAHNVKIGSSTIVAGCTAIAGNVKIGNGVLIGGRACITGHVTIGDGSIVYGQTPVSKSFPANSKILSGWPAEDYKNWIKKVIFFNKLFDYSITIFEKIRHIKKKIRNISRKIKLIPNFPKKLLESL